MPDDVRLEIDFEAVEDFYTGAKMKAMLLGRGTDVAERARAAAPRRTGAGADSIQALPRTQGGTHSEAQVRVSWARIYYYMYFHERGTVTLPARPFLVPALLGI